MDAPNSHAHSPLGRALQVARPLTLLIALLSGCAGSQEVQDSPNARTYAFWPQFPAEPRMQFLVSYQFSADIEPPKSGLEELIYGKETRILPIRKPYGVEMWNGRIYVCDTKNAAVLVLDVRNQQMRMMGAAGMGKLTSPSDIAIAPDGLKYVSDSQRGAIFVYDVDERHVGSFGYEGLRPTGIAVHGDELYVCDFVTQQVHILDRHSGRKLRTIGERGDEDGQFVKPLGIDVDGEGNVYVTDVIRCRVQKFSPDGKLISAHGSIGDMIGQFVRPKHIAVDRDGVSYVVDASFANVQMFNEEDRLLMFFGAAGGFPGGMYLPAGVCVHDGDLDLFEQYVHPAFQAERLVVVTNQFGPRKVSVYAFGQLKEGKTPQDIATAVVDLPTGLMTEGQEPTMPQLGGEEGEAPAEGAPDAGEAPAPGEAPPPGSGEGTDR